MTGGGASNPDSGWLASVFNADGVSGIRGLLRALASLGWMQRHRLIPVLIAAAVLSAPPALLIDDVFRPGPVLR